MVDARGEEAKAEGESAVVRALRKQDALEALQSPAPASIHFICGDIFQLSEWCTDARVVYASSLLFSAEMMAALLSLVVKMPAGSVFMSLKELPLEDKELNIDCGHVEHVFESYYEMSWHRSKIYFYSIREK